MFRGVPHDRDHDHPDENFGDSERSAHAFNRPDQKLRKQRHHSGREHQDHDGFGPAPVFDLFFELTFAPYEKMFVCPEGEHEHAEIGNEEDDGDA